MRKYYAERDDSYPYICDENHERVAEMCVRGQSAWNQAKVLGQAGHFAELLKDTLGYLEKYHDSLGPVGDTKNNVAKHIEDIKNNLKYAGVRHGKR